jgi:hypothetical protein
MEVRWGELGGQVIRPPRQIHLSGKLSASWAIVLQNEEGHRRAEMPCFRTHVEAYPPIKLEALLQGYRRSALHRDNPDIDPNLTLNLC